MSFVYSVVLTLNNVTLNLFSVGIYDDERVEPCNLHSVHDCQCFGKVEHFHLPTGINPSVLLVVKSVDLFKVGTGTKCMYSQRWEDGGTHIKKMGMLIGSLN